MLKYYFCGEINTFIVEQPQFIFMQSRASLPANHFKVSLFLYTTMSLTVRPDNGNTLTRCGFDFECHDEMVGLKTLLKLHFEW